MDDFTKRRISDTVDKHSDNVAKLLDPIATLVSSPTSRDLRAELVKILGYPTIDVGFGTAIIGSLVAEHYAGAHHDLSEVRHVIATIAAVGVCDDYFVAPEIGHYPSCFADAPAYQVFCHRMRIAIMEIFGDLNDHYFRSGVLPDHDRNFATAVAAAKWTAEISHQTIRKIFHKEE